MTRLFVEHSHHNLPGIEASSNISSEPHLLGGDLLGETVQFSLQTRHFLGEGSEEKLGPGQQLWARDN